MVRSIWAILGVARDADTRTIRRAYAGKLKEFDADAEPARFIALNEAYQSAMDAARWRERYGEDDWDDEHAEAAEPVEPAPSEPLETPSAPEDVVPVADAVPLQPAPAPVLSPWQEEPGPELYDRLIGLLYRGDEGPIPPLTEDEAAEVDSLTQRFLRWLAGRPVDEAADYEFAIGNLMAASFPRSDVILEPVSAYFNWDASGHHWDRPESIREVLERRDGNLFYMALLDPEHQLHNAFVALTGDKVVPLWQRKLRGEVIELLKLTKTRYPSLLPLYNLDRLQEWQGKVSFNPGDNTEPDRPNRWWLVWIVIVVLANVARTCPASEDKTPPPDMVTQTFGESSAEQETHLDVSLAGLTNNALRRDGLSEPNPELATALQSNRLGMTGKHITAASSLPEPRFSAAFSSKGTSADRRTVRRALARTLAASGSPEAISIMREM